MFEIHPRENFIPDSDLNISPKSFKSELQKLLSTQKQLTKNNVYIEVNPTTIELAKLSKIGYKDFPKAKRKLKADNKLKNFELVCCGYNKRNSYHASLYFREGDETRHRQLIFVHRGTEGLDYKDWHANLQGVVRNEITSQINSSCTFSLKAMSAMAGVNNPVPVQIVVSGHSLGGWLAQISTYAIKYLDIFPQPGAGQLDVFYRRSEERCHPHCKVFDSPGALQMLQYLGTMFSSDKQKQSGTKDIRLDISNIVLFPNMINVMNEHCGEMIQIVHTENKFQKGFTSIQLMSAVNVMHTFYFHSMKTIRDALLVSNGNADSKSPKLIKVANWPLVIFKNWNTQMDKKSKAGWSSILRRFTKIGAKELFTYDLMNQYKEWLENGENHYSTECIPCEYSSCVESMLSDHENQIIHQLQQICAYRNYFSNSIPKIVQLFEDYPFLKLITSDNLNPIQRKGIRIYFPSDEYYLFLKNCGLMRHDFKNAVSQLPNNRAINAICKSQIYIDTIQERFLVVKFLWKLILDLNDIQTQEFVHTDRDLLTLLLLKIVSQVRNCEENLSPDNTIVLKYDTLDPIFSSTGGTSTCKIKLIVIDCIDVADSSQIDTTRHILPVTKHIWIRKENEGDTNCNYAPHTFSIQLTRESFDTIIMKKCVTIQGQIIAMGSLMPHEKRPDLQNLLNESPKSLLSLLDNFPTSTLAIGRMPKTIFELKNIYFDVGMQFSVNNELKIKSHFTNDDGNTHYIVVYSDLSLEVLKMKLKVKIQNDRYTVIPNDSNILSEFQRICRTRWEEFVDLVCYRSSANEDEFEHILQYNPSFYVNRKVDTPILEIRDLCRKMVEIKKSLRIKDVVINPDHRDEMSNTNMLHKIGISFTEETMSFKEVCIPLESIAHVDIDPDLSLFGTIRATGHQNQKLASIFPDISFVIGESDMLAGRDIVILSDEPGMGKSTSLLKTVTDLLLSKNVVNSHQNLLLVVFIELKDLLNLEILNSNTSPSCIHSFVQCLSKHSGWDELSSLILLTNLLCPQEGVDILFAFDGFDEMESENQSLFCKALQHIRRTTRAKIIISTRQHDSVKLEQALCVLHHRFREIEGHVDFLVNFWTGVVDGKTDKIRKFAEVVIDKAHHYLRGDAKRARFLGVPLQLKLLTEAFLSDLVLFIEQSQTSNEVDPHSLLQAKYNLCDVYDKFIRKKYEIYIQQKLGYSDNQRPKASTGNQIKMEKVQQEVYEPYLIKLSGLSLKLGKEFETIFQFIYGQKPYNDQDKLNDLYRTGIIHKESISPQFLHRTFAELFVAKLLVMAIKQMQQDNCNLLVNLSVVKACLVDLFTKKILVKDGWVIATFMDGILMGDCKRNRECFEAYSTQVILHEEKEDFGNCLECLINDRQPYLLWLVLNTMKLKKEDVLNQLQHLWLNFSLFYVQDLADIAPILVMLSYIRKLVHQSIADIPFLAFHMGKDSAPQRNPTTRQLAEVIFYSINDAIDILSGKTCKIEGMKDFTANAFVLRNPCGALLLHDNAKAQSWIKNLENCLFRWDGTMDSFPYPELQITSNASRLEFMHFSGVFRELFAFRSKDNFKSGFNFEVKSLQYWLKK